MLVEGDLEEKDCHGTLYQLHLEDEHAAQIASFNVKLDCYHFMALNRILDGRGQGTDCIFWKALFVSVGLI